jgi:hypothetical protein
MRASSVTIAFFPENRDIAKGYSLPVPGFEGGAFLAKAARMLKLLIGCALLVACGGSPMEPAPSVVPGVTPSPPPPSSNPGSPIPNPGEGAVRLNDDFGGRQLFPSDNWWNQEITNAPVDAQSSAYIDFIGRTRAAHPDFGPPPYGIPFVGVGGTEARTPVAFVDYGDESDAGFRGEAGYPIPDAAKTQPNFIEGSVPGGGSDGDRHILISRQRWEAGSGAVFDLSSNARRPEGWTSADAAGLAILPGLVRYDEAIRGPIRHALRATVRRTNDYVWPASHRAGSTAGALPMGARLRLKASKDLSRFPPYIQNMFRAMQTYGLIVADNGSDMYVTGAMDARWNNSELNPAFSSLTAGDFDVIRLGWR